MTHKAIKIRHTALIIIFLSAFQAGIAEPFSRGDSAALSDEWFRQGSAHLMARDWIPALRSLTKALHYATDENRQAAIHQNLGSLHFLLSDYQKAAIYSEHAFHLLNGKRTDRSRLAEICLNLGFTWLERGETEKAERWFAIAGKCGVPDNPMWRTRLALGKGNLLFSKGSFREAIATYSDALISCDRDLPVTEEDLWLRKNLAWSLQSIGRIDSAILMLDQALERIWRSGRTNNFTLGEIQLQKSLLLVSSKQQVEALQLLNETLDLAGREANLTISTGNTASQLKTMDVLMYRILYEKLRLEWTMSGISKSDPVDLKGLYKEVVGVLKLGEALVADRQLKELMSLQPELQRSLSGIAIELLFLTDRDSSGFTGEVIGITERLSLFEKRCQTGDDRDFFALPDSLRRSFSGLKRQLFRLHKQRFLEGIEPMIPDPERTGQGVRVVNLLDSFDKMSLGNTSGSFQDNQDNYLCPERYKFENIHSLLNRDEAWISYQVFDTTLYTIVITSDTAFIFKQYAVQETAGDVEGFIRALKELDPQALRLFSGRLYARLINPVEEQLAGKFFLRIIPGMQFRYLPFDALTIHESELKGDSGKFLISRFETTCYSSITACLREKLDTSGFLGNQTYRYDFGACAPELAGSEVTSIPHAVHEVERISRLFRMENRRTRILSGEGIPEDSLLEMGGQSRIFHLATHGVRDSGHPEFSGWMLSGDPSPSPYRNNQQPRIEIGALQSFQMECDMVVLSSCAIGAEQGRSSYRITGVPDNFFNAGVHHVMFSLWDVSDKHADDLMYAFYRNYLDGMSYSAALRAAKLKMLSVPETAFPTIWAVFVLWSD